ncbi:hypothetical protein [Deinococcus maricopensis]|uniref:Uncharacterized protein n=1 Tax=Deinococcus maricopensis (strain DSM 21211 / LMG 22137 / NRRL B-23946 / LB-34) TaxID=709986 RepID=E8U335_DEIML|nr:hypothetical protein [Deinococcus maricopensis]ADV65773.1 hypothetical protein Deima_0109 [Deinococcus maricopensis DSM 21211]
MDLQEQIERMRFPAGTQVSMYREGPDNDTVFRVMQRDQNGKRGLELVLTHDAEEMYGEGPMVHTALQELYRRVEAGLPEVVPGQEYTRLTYTGD